MRSTQNYYLQSNCPPVHPAPVFTRPPLTSRSRSNTLMIFGDDTPPLSVCEHTSISGSSLSSLDLYDVDTILRHSVHSTSIQQHVSSRTRARGQGHRRCYSHIRSSRTGSVYETIQEELSSIISGHTHIKYYVSVLLQYVNNGVQSMFTRSWLSQCQ